MAIELKRKALLGPALLGLLAASAYSQTKPGTPTEAQAPPATAVEVAKVGFADGSVEVLKPGGAWAKALEGQALAIGDRVRTQRGGSARLEFPWTAVALGDSSEVSIEKARQLTLRLESGRIDVDPEQTLLRVITAEAAVSGTGRTLMRRQGATTFVGSYNGGAEVEGAGSSVRLGLNKGTIVNAGKAPTPPAPLPRPPRVVSPSSDPRYVTQNQVVHLTWTGDQPSYHLEILPIDSDVPILSVDVDAMEYDARLPWLGTYRWRVAGRDGAVESEASGEGLICVVDK